MTVESEHIDRMGHVNNVVYLRWVQDIAVAHWKAMVLEEELAQVLWVVRRHEIEYKRPAFLGEELLLKTWIEEATRRTFHRRTDIRRKSDSRLLVQATTIWCPVDPESKALTAVNDKLVSRFLQDKSPPRK